MTPKKKAKLSSPFKPHEWQEGYGIYENGFVKGAEWMLVKALKWLTKNAQNYYDDAAMYAHIR